MPHVQGALKFLCLIFYQILVFFSIYFCLDYYISTLGGGGGGGKKS